MSQKKYVEEGVEFETSDLLVFSHLRWNFVYQRPQHLMSRFARVRRVFFFEEPIFEHAEEPRFEISADRSGVRIIVPHLPFEYSPDSIEIALSQAVDELIAAEDIEEYTVWYYTPMALAFTRHLQPKAVLYDCMDELSLFKGAPSVLVDNEVELMTKSDLVFTGGRSLYEAKKDLHDNIHAFPSGIDLGHFSRARQRLADPLDQQGIARPRLGYFGVIDERIDLDLVGRTARLRPDWNIVLVGPTAKIEPSELPRRKNIFYLGQKDYAELPHYISGWDVAIMPFARNEATRFISPTKTPEYLAAGRSVVSTPITDVINPYGHAKMVRIASNAREFVAAVDEALHERRSESWYARIDRFLEGRTWEETWQRMAQLEAELHIRRTRNRPARPYADWREASASYDMTN